MATKKKSSTLIGSTKSYRNPNYLGPTVKLDKQKILGGNSAKPKVLSKKFFGCSANNNPYDKEVIAEVANDLLEEFQSYEQDQQISKAGFIPYFIDQQNQIYMMFVKSSDPAYGGSRFMLAKGHVDKGENDLQAAMREAKEECGLEASNIVPGSVKLGWKGQITGYTETSIMSIFIGRVKDRDPSSFSKPGFEVSETTWMTPQQFAANGRRSQAEIVVYCARQIKK